MVVAILARGRPRTNQTKCCGRSHLLILNGTRGLLKKGSWILVILYCHSITWPSVSGTLNGSDMGDSFVGSVTVTTAVTFFNALSLKVVAS
jgi:hypothetical protein